MSYQTYEFIVLMSILLGGGAVFCLVGAIIERWWHD